ncbi:DNA-directed DNA polymerase eta rad30 [Vermiconidia calcicola]|uniref:DNA-directed DNA polymerase eta rad30 n=1 Tax=Vermiconidia calcicola TaxID=1690605 RepID=A0ACC3N8S5_9PEZI|nr:DNA-directed DNA polymerase eta rad30 [Vermiconidia calcicola]
MSSQPFVSSPFSPHARRKRRSKFTYKHLSTLAHSGTNCPLRVIAHIDLDAFYAQCESVRLGIDPSKPLAVQQWQGLIAINYPARAYGLNRHVPITEAKEKCPEIICQHVATWKEGDTKWSYSDDSDQAFKEIAIRKVSLDPYRIQSRKILALIKECLPKDLQKVEKASIDEVFLDLSAQVHSILLERYPELQGPAPYDDPSEPLPRPPTTALDWAADALVDLDSTHSEEDDPDWDDIVMLIASEIVRDVRKAIFDELHYTCSAGLSRNKMLAKLGSGHKKPNSQTVIRNRAVQHFLSSFKFTKIRNLGGKLGDEVVAAFNTDLVSDLLPVPLDKLKRQLGDDTGSWLYGVIRGEDQSEVNPRTAIKSMLSAKSFRPSINSFEVACKWLRIFVADIFSRLVEEGVLENKRRPKTINLHHRQGAQTRSKQAPIPMGKTITEDALYDQAKNLLAQVIVDGRAWPCANLSLSVGGFEDGVTGNKGIGSFLVRGDEAKALRTSSLGREDSIGEGTETPPPTKKRRTDAGITRFFGTSQYLGSAAEGVEPEAYVISNDSDLEDDAPDLDGEVEEEEIEMQDPTLPPPSAQPRPAPNPLPDEHRPPDQVSPQESIELYHCERCSKDIPVENQMEHEDFHFAQSLQNEHSSQFHPQPNPVPRAKTPSQPTKPRGRGRPPMSVGGNGGVEKGQRKLAFG